MITIEEARKTISDLAEAEGEYQFASDVRLGLWDHRNDVQSVMAGTFTPRKLRTGHAISNSERTDR